jgi:hypothetical protein
MFSKILLQCYRAYYNIATPLRSASGVQQCLPMIILPQPMHGELPIVHLHVVVY